MTHLSNTEIKRLCDESLRNSRFRRLDKELHVTAWTLAGIVFWCGVIVAFLIILALLTGVPVNP